MEGLTKNFQDCNVNDEPKKKLGLVPLAAKVDRNPEGTPVTLHTNLRKLNVEPNTPVYKYSVKILYVFSTADDSAAVHRWSLQPAWSQCARIQRSRHQQGRGDRLQENERRAGIRQQKTVKNKIQCLIFKF
ncbi:hypothetical protein L5515_017689 [Caenorhabditis briggsae]|uniref:Uncharacterized protein n=1 Tax=Caenorhabditis briggsae TaxID=6238 RepID=A0AAE9FED8_CAEBR|nr:hypothetical protein L5515_017689 [Caenorhabditis briggsae]